MTVGHQPYAVEMWVIMAESRFKPINWFVMQIDWWVSVRCGFFNGRYFSTDFDFFLIECLNNHEGKVSKHVEKERKMFPFFSRSFFMSALLLAINLLYQPVTIPEKRESLAMLGTVRTVQCFHSQGSRPNFFCLHCKLIAWFPWEWNILIWESFEWNFTFSGNGWL